MRRPPTFGQPLAGRTYRRRPAVYAVIVDQQRQVALVRVPRGYFLPGGAIDPGETPQDALRREVAEECCHTIHVERGLGSTIQYFSTPEQDYEMRATFFVARFTGVVAGIPEHDLQWMAPAEARRVVFHACFAWAIEMWQQGVNQHG